MIKEAILFDVGGVVTEALLFGGSLQTASVVLVPGIFTPAVQLQRRIRDSAVKKR